MVVENIFSVPGLGRLFVNRMLRTDHMMIMGVTIVSAVAIIVPYIYPYTYTQQDVTAKHLEPFEYSRKEQTRIARGRKGFLPHHGHG